MLYEVITYKLYDTLGRIVDQGILKSSVSEKEFNINLTAGVYIISFVSGSDCLRNKIVVEQ